MYIVRSRNTKIVYFEMSNEHNLRNINRNNTNDQMFSYSFRQLFRQCLTVQTVEKCLNRINARKFESNSINACRTLCTAIQKIDNKNDQKNQQTNNRPESKDSEVQDRCISKIKSIFKCNTKEAIEIFNVLKTPQMNPNLSDIVIKVKWLRRRNIQLGTILDNYKLLLQPFGKKKKSFSIYYNNNYL